MKHQQQKGPRAGPLRWRLHTTADPTIMDVVATAVGEDEGTYKALSNAHSRWNRMYQCKAGLWRTAGSFHLVSTSGYPHVLTEKVTR
jgi:hypothetical protein